MKRILLDENLPIPLRLLLREFDVVTVQFHGWSGIQNGELLALADDRFDVLITGDKNLRYQQNMAGRRIAIIEVPFTRLSQIEPYIESIKRAILNASTGSYRQIEE